jgi:hypothetical protein
MERIDWTDFTVVETIELDDTLTEDHSLAANLGFANDQDGQRTRQEIAHSEPIKVFGMDSMENAFEDLIRKQGVPINSSFTKCTICDKTIPASEHSEHIKTHFPSSSSTARQEKPSEGVFRPPVEISNISRTTASTAMLIQQQKRLHEETLKSQEGPNNQVKGPQIPQGMKLPPVPAKPQGSGTASKVQTGPSSEENWLANHPEILSINILLPDKLRKSHGEPILNIQIDPRTTISQLKDLISENIGKKPFLIFFNFTGNRRKRKQNEAET